MTVPSKTRNVALQCSIKEQTEMEQTRTAWPDFDYPMVLILGAGIMEDMYSPHRKWLCALFSGGCSYLSVRKLIWEALALGPWAHPAHQAVPTRTKDPLKMKEEEESSRRWGEEDGQLEHCRRTGSQCRLLQRFFLRLCALNTESHPPASPLLTGGCTSQGHRADLLTAKSSNAALIPTSWSCLPPKVYCIVLQLRNSWSSEKNSSNINYINRPQDSEARPVWQPCKCYHPALGVLRNPSAYWCARIVDIPYGPPPC